MPLMRRNASSKRAVLHAACAGSAGPQAAVTTRSMQSRAPWLGLVIALLGLCVPASLMAAPGDYLELVDVELDGVNGVDGLGAARSVAASWDGKHVYVAALVDDSLALFSADEATGELRFRTLYRDGQNGNDGLQDAVSVTLSPDGAQVYVAASGEHAVSVFDRDRRSGELTLRKVLRDGLGGVDGLRGAFSVRVSPDGSNVFVVGAGERSLAVFARDPANGVLTFVEVHRDGVAGVDALDGANSVAVSREGRSVYVSASVDEAIAIFIRNPGTGGLSYVGAVRQGVGGVDGLVGAAYVSVSPDGRNVYAVGNTNNSLVVFSRSPTSGALTFVEQHLDNVAGVDGLASPSSVTVHPAGHSVYVTSLGDRSVAVFARNLTNGSVAYVETQSNGQGGGAGLNEPVEVFVRPGGKHLYAVALDSVATFATPLLSFVELHQDGVAGVDGLNGINEIALSPEGTHLYTAARSDDAIAVFERDVHSGSLSYLRSYRDGLGGITSLDGVFSVTVSPDGLNLYAVAPNEDSLTVFSRDPATGFLTQAQVLQHGVNGVTHLQTPSYVRVSHDGRNVYATAFQSGAVVAFSRNTTTGNLSFLEAKTAGGNLDGALELVLSRDGMHLYAAGSTNDALVWIRRDPATGAMSVVQTSLIAASPGGVRGLALSPDGERLYMTQAGGSLWAFPRNIHTGQLSSFPHPLNIQAWSVAADPGGRYIHATSASQDLILAYAQTLDTTLIRLDVQASNVAGVGEVDSPSSLALSRGGNHLYVGGQGSDSLALFRVQTSFFVDGFESGDITAW